MPTKNSGLMSSALLQIGVVADQPPNGIEGRRGACRLDVRLAEEEGDAGAEQHHRDADRDVVHLAAACRSSRASRRSTEPATPAASTPSQGEPV